MVSPMRLIYETTTTLKVRSPFWGSHEIEVQVTKGRVSILPPVGLPANIDAERAQDLARVIMAAAIRGRIVHRKLFGRNP